MKPQHSPATSPIAPSLLTTIHASDQAIYPTALPLSRLREWVAACPELSIAFSHGGSSHATHDDDPANGPNPLDDTQGVIIVLPLQRAHWEHLLVGKVAEGAVEVDMFPPPCHGGSEEERERGEGEDVEVGLHVYHVERFDGSDKRKGFTERALGEVRRRVRKCWPGCKVIGVSALTATEAGRRTFARLGFQQTGYREVFVTRGASEEGVGQQAVDMVCYFPGDEGIVQGAVVSTSEMVVRYETEVFV